MEGNGEAITVLGAGSYGTCLAIMFARVGHRVTLWCRNPATAASLERERENKAYLPGFALPEGLVVTSDAVAAVRGAAIIVGVTPSHGIREIFTLTRDAISDDAIVVNAAKGLEDGTLAMIDAVYREILPPRVAARATFLSGPTFAAEIAAGMPAAIVLAGRDAEATAIAQKVLSSAQLRIYSTDDVPGVLIGGALKNVIAIAAGVSDGLALGSNARAAVITRGLAEIMRIGIAVGAEPATFAGLSGMGDLVLTCSGDASRNRKVGLALGQGRAMADILGEMKMVAEGVKTTRVAHQLAAKLGVSAPITAVMNAIVHEGAEARKAMTTLMQRALRSEKE